MSSLSGIGNLGAFATTPRALSFLMTSWCTAQSCQFSCLRCPSWWWWYAMASWCGSSWSLAGGLKEILRAREEDCRLSAPNRSRLRWSSLCWLCSCSASSLFTLPGVFTTLLDTWDRLIQHRWRQTLTPMIKVLLMMTMVMMNDMKNNVSYFFLFIRSAVLYLRPPVWPIRSLDLLPAPTAVWTPFFTS